MEVVVQQVALRRVMEHMVAVPKKSEKVTGEPFQQ
jgi:hypothetical protein